MAVEHVAGKNVGHIMLYALSTCVWCKKAKALLDGLGVEYYYEYVDLLQGNDKEKVVKTLERWNPSRNFPTLVINDNKCIIGFKEDEIREALEP